MTRLSDELTRRSLDQAEERAADIDRFSPPGESYRVEWSTCQKCHRTITTFIFDDGRREAVHYCKPTELAS